MSRTPAWIGLASLLFACSPPVPTPDASASDARADASSASDAELDSSAPEDSGVPVMDSGVDTGVIIDTGVRIDSGVIVDTGVRDTGIVAPCTLDPNNCGMCGRVCSGGRPLCAEVAGSMWDCVQFCGPGEASCAHPDGGRICCSIGACAVNGIGCR